MGGGRGKGREQKSQRIRFQRYRWRLRRGTTSPHLPPLTPPLNRPISKSPPSEHKFIILGKERNGTPGSFGEPLMINRCCLVPTEAGVVI